MPCYDNRSSIDSEANRETAAEYRCIEAMLCAVMRAIEQAKCSDEVFSAYNEEKAGVRLVHLRKWYQTHKAADAGAT